MVLEFLKKRLKKINSIGQYIVGNYFDKEFKKCIDRFKEQKELFELIMQVNHEWVSVKVALANFYCLE